MPEAVTQCNIAQNLLGTFFFLSFKFGQNMLNTRSCMKERTNEQTYTTTKHITTLLLRSRVKKETIWIESLRKVHGTNHGLEESIDKSDKYV